MSDKYELVKVENGKYRIRALRNIWGFEEERNEDNFTRRAK